MVTTIVEDTFEVEFEELGCTGPTLSNYRLLKHIRTDPFWREVFTYGIYLTQDTQCLTIIEGRCDYVQGLWAVLKRTLQETAYARPTITGK